MYYVEILLTYDRAWTLNFGNIVTIVYWQNIKTVYVYVDNMHVTCFPMVETIDFIDLGPF